MNDSLDIGGPHLHTVQIRHGDRNFHFFHDNENDHIFRQVKATGTFYEPSLLASLGTRLRPGDVVVDVGANIGNHTIYFAGVCGCRVVAFEPNPDAARLLRAAISQNGLAGRVDVREIALGHSAGVGYLDESAAADNLGAVGVVVGEEGVVRIYTLDSQELPGSPRLIKIDAEGMEADILRGANRVLRRSRPMVCVEAKTVTEFDAVADILLRHKLLPVETHNYSATHIFVSPARVGRASVRDSVAVQGARNYVRTSEIQKNLLAKLLQVETRNMQLESRILELEIAFASHNSR